MLVAILLLLTVSAIRLDPIGLAAMGADLLNQAKNDPTITQAMASMSSMKEDTKLKKSVVDTLTDHQQAKAVVENFADQIRGFQKTIEEIDAELYKPSEGLLLKVQKLKLDIAGKQAAISKMLRAFYDHVYPERKRKPIYLAPVSSKDLVISQALPKAERFWAQYQTGARNECTRIAQVAMKLRDPGILGTEDNFMRDAQLITALPAVERLAMDLQKVNEYDRLIARSVLALQAVEGTPVATPPLAGNAVATPPLAGNAVATLAGNPAATLPLAGNAAATPPLAGNAIATPPLAGNAVATPPIPPAS